MISLLTGRHNSRRFIDAIGDLTCQASISKLPPSPPFYDLHDTMRGNAPLLVSATCVGINNPPGLGRRISRHRLLICKTTHYPKGTRPIKRAGPPPFSVFNSTPF